ncbi:zf-HC2 domain-containing protein [Streptomyces sp. st140]|uniref:zf-HC2 domain-containing protein n=1 Tax=Streptomyces sp. st140 TaxID=1828052 RepID=UPI000BEF6693|nr:zf-HC2 domain-containing protein [Streptomyces sp. st140]
MTGGGRESEGGEEEVRGARRIPGPRGAADDLDLASVPLPPLPPPGGNAPDEAVPEQSQPAPASGDAPETPESDAGEPEPDLGPGPAAEAWPEPGPGPEPDPWPEAEPADGTPRPAAPEWDPAAPAAEAWPGPDREPEPADGTPEPHAPDPLVSSAPVVLPHQVLKALLGAWALSACSAEETAAVEDHLTGCAPCADEALRLRDAVGLLHTDGSLDLDPTLRTRVLDGCFGRRPARIPVPEWAAPYDAETARLDALLRDIGDSEWHAPVRLQWFEEERQVSRRTTVAGVIGHLMAVDGLLSAALGLDDPLDGGKTPLDPTERTETYWSATRRPPTRAVREPWRAQSHELIRTASFAGRNVAETSVSYGAFALPLQDAALDRAFECWVHGGDIADAVDYPYPAPSAAHLHRMIDLAARMLPAALAGRRSAGLAGPAKDLVAAGAPGRSLHLEIEGHGGGDWYIALDSPAAVGAPERAVAQVALDGVEFCRLVAGHISPVEAAAGQEGDREAIRDVLFAAASLSRL